LGTLLQIAFPDFHFQLAAPLTSARFQGNSLIHEASVDNDTRVVLTLTGSLVEDSNEFALEQTFLKMAVAEARARAGFVAATLTAMIGLAGEVDLRIPGMKPDLKLSFDVPLSEISRMLHHRQVAYRLMVIERATGMQFLLPPIITDHEEEVIAFIYRAIVDRSFIWPSQIAQVSVPATKEWLCRLTLAQLADIPIPYSIPSQPISETLLGQPIFLGHGTVIIEDGIIQQADDVRRELEREDGHPVKVVIRSLGGQIRYELPEAPRLPNTPWDSKIQALIDLESQLDARLADRYHALAAATLADLTEEEKKAVTARPELEEDAFLIDDSDGE
jgi:hypothetical protein